MRPPLQPISASPEEVAARLRAALLPIRSVWFPSLDDLRRWDQSTSPLYLRLLSGGRFEAGPRLASMWAACFSPVVRGELRSEGGGTVLTWRRTWPRATAVILSIWAVLLAAWAAALANSILVEGQPAGHVGFWVVVAGAAVVGLLLGDRLGGAALESALPWLVEVASSEPVDEDW